MTGKRRKRLINIVGATVVALLIGGVAAVGGIIYILNHYGKDLPDYTQLAQYEPPVVSRIYADFGQLSSRIKADNNTDDSLLAIPSFYAVGRKIHNKLNDLLWNY